MMASNEPKMSPLPQLEEELLCAIFGDSTRGEYASSDARDQSIQEVVTRIESEFGRTALANVLDGWVKQPQLDRPEINPLAERDPYPLIIAEIAKMFPWKELVRPLEELNQRTLTNLEKRDIGAALQRIRSQ